MKNNYLPRVKAVVALLVLLLACFVSANANPVDNGRARQVAANFLNITRSADLMDVSAEAGFTNVYVFTTENSFVLLAADDRVQPILGYSLNGRFDVENMPDNKRAWIQEYSDAIQDAIDNQRSATAEVTQQWRDLAEGHFNRSSVEVIIGPLLQTHWDQDAPYNYQCPTGTVTGCVATAMAQVMKYWNFPSHGIGSYSYTHPTYGQQSANFQNTTYSWSNMLNSYSGSYNSTQRDAVATLMYHCGVSVDMNYGPTSGAGTSNVADALKTYFGYSSDVHHRSRTNISDDDWIAMLKADLDQQRPIQYHGSGSGGGHSFVCDGYRSDNYFHFNWGWSGYCDEYYTINNLNPGPGGTGSGSNGIYNDSQGAIFGVHPSSNTATPPTLSYTVSGTTVNLSWTSATGAVSYNIYRDDIMIANTTSTSYAVNHCHGTMRFYVRSVNSSNDLSLSSNMVTANVSVATPLVDDLAASVSGQNVTLTWSDPDWCYPSTPTATLTYGSGEPSGYSLGFSNPSTMYWGHRYPSTSLSSYNNKKIYKVSFYTNDGGSYQVCLFQGSTTYSGDRLGPQTPIGTQTVSVPKSGWHDVDLTNPIVIDASNDYWVFIYDSEGRYYPAAYADYTGSDGNYYTSNLYEYIPSTYSGVAFLIRTYVTDGTYNYDLYRNGSRIAANLSTTTHNDNNLAYGTYNYYVKTHYYGGVTDASNTVTVTLAAAMHTISATASPTSGGTITGAGSYAEGTLCTLTASPSTGYHFVKWTKNGTQVSTNASYSFTVTEDATYVANFAVNTYTITANANPTAGGTVSGGGSYSYGDICPLSAIANTGYTFVNWTKNGTVVSTSPNYNVSVHENAAYVANFQLRSYTITANANPTAGGTVTGGGSYNYGASCTLTATANTGYTFVNWTKNGTQVSTNASYNFTVTEAATYVANFQINSYTIAASADPAGGGTITGAGTYNYGDICTLSVTTNPGYTFVNWTKNGTVVATASTYNVTVYEDATYVAHFNVNGYEITATANPTEGGTISGTGVYNYGASCTLTATANTGYTFQNWTKNGTVVSTNTSINFTVTESAAYVANFQINSYNITASANPSAGGSVTGGGSYNYGTTCTLTATTNTGYSFVNWTKNGTQVSTNPSYSFTVTEDATYVAHFQINSYTITVNANPSIGGTVSGGGSYNYGTICTISATPATGYHFVNWTKNGTVVATAPNYNVTVYEDATYIANFEINSYTITASANPSVGGTVSGGGTYNHGSSCMLTATPAADYIFTNWTKNGTVVSTSASYSFTVTEDATYVANFVPDQYTITVTANPTSGGTVSGGGVYYTGTSCTITATPRTGYNFVNWTKNGTVVSTNTSYSFTVTEDAAYVAHFTPITYSIAVSADPTEGGTVNGAGTYNHGTTCTLTATANAGYTFSNWTKNGTVVSSSPSYSFTVLENATYVAHFTLNMYMITVSADPTSGGTVAGGGAYFYGDNCTVLATPNTGYSFTNWTKNGTVVSTNATYTFNVTQDADLVAHFSLDHYTIIVSATPEAGGTATGGGSFTYGQTCTLSATPNTGYSFLNWTKDGSVVSTNASYSFAVTGNGNYVANFAVSYHTITVLAEPAEGGTVSGGGTRPYGSIATLRAVANEGYEFVNWTKDGNVVSTNPIYAVPVREDVEYVAHFQINVYEIKANTEPFNTGDIVGAGYYNYGETCTLTITPHDEYAFINWTLDGEVVSENETITFVVTEDRHYVAHLQHEDGIVEQGSLTVSLFPNPVKNKLTIEASEPVNMLEIYTIDGALVYKQNNCSEMIEISVATYANGTYMIRLTTDSTVEIRRFVKE